MSRGLDANLIRTAVAVCASFIAVMVAISVGGSAIPRRVEPVRPVAAAGGSVDQRMASWQRCGATGLILLPTVGACTHGADLHAGASGTSAQDARDFVAPSCRATQDNHLEVVYAHVRRGDRLRRVLPMIDEAVGVANGIVAHSAAQTRGFRRLSLVTHMSRGRCVPVVVDLTVTSRALNDLSSLVVALANAGLDRLDRKYIVFGDGTSALCGIASLYDDDRPGPENLNNTGTSVALVGNRQGCWTGAIVVHEIVHMLGGVQTSAPHSTAGNHCNDGNDPLCYNDGTARSKQNNDCPRVDAFRLDCGHNDYFSTQPPRGSYLATHWNVANSSFLIGGGPPMPVVPGAPQAVDASLSGTSVVVTWATAPGRVTGYVIVLPSGTSVLLATTARSYTDSDGTADAGASYSVAAVNEAGEGPVVTVDVTTGEQTQSLPLPLAVPDAATWS